MYAPDVAPYELEERRVRGWCTCPQVSDVPSGAVQCIVHPDGDDLLESDRASRGMWFFDDRRNRHVTWPDAVEAMRQRRYTGATNRELVLHTWGTLVRLLESLHQPFDEPEPVITEQRANELIEWAGRELDADQQRWLLGFARGGGAPALMRLFRSVARRAVADARQCSKAPDGGEAA